MVRVGVLGALGIVKVYTPNTYHWV
jgi:hypothetical protein